MAIETATFLDDLNPAQPTRDDFLYEGDDHIALLKLVLQNTFTNADQAFDMSLILGGITPVGGIIAFVGEVAPAGWGICDGSEYDLIAGGTIVSPNISGKVLLGAVPGDPDYGLGQSSSVLTQNVVSATGGAHAHTGTTTGAGAHNHTITGSTVLSVDNMPAHNHGGGNHTHGSDKWLTDEDQHADNGSGSKQIGDSALIPNSGTIINTQGSNTGHNHTIPTTGNHSHGLAVATSANHSHTVSVDIIPPYYAQTYIIKL